mmetsp:Transcript_36991/g.85362  ORF Transcript_36991/g.85362 Transcript_36991/m.85362 type:complete len:761 (+) Transcript_36991:63-2345(+)
MAKELLLEAQAKFERGGSAADALNAATSALQTARSDPVVAAEALRFVLKLRTSKGESAAVEKLLEDELGKVAKDSVQEALLWLCRAECPSPEYLDEESYDAVSASCEQARLFFEKHGEKEFEVDAMLALSGLYLRHPSSTSSDREAYADKAVKEAKRARAQIRTLGDKRREAAALHMEAVAYATFGDLESDAVRLEREALALYKGLGLLAMTLLSLQCIAQWQLAADEPTPAQQCAKEAWELAQTMDPCRQVEALLVQVQACIATDSIEEALRLPTKAVRKFRASGHKREEAYALLALMYAYFADDDPDEALSVAADARAAFVAVDDSKGVLQVQQAMAQCHLQEREFDDALAIGKEVAETATLAGSMQDRLLALQCQAFAHSASGSVQDARATAGELRKRVEKVDVQAADAVAAVMSADTSLRHGELQWAIASAHDAAEVLQSLDSKQEEAMACRLLAKAYLAQKSQDLYAASQMAERALLCSQSAGDKAQETEASLLLAQIQLACIVEDALADDPKSGVFKASMTKALKVSESAVRKARKLRQKSLEATALCVLAQLQTLNSAFTQAMESCAQAGEIYEELGEPRNAASAKVLLADVYLANDDDATAAELAAEAEATFRSQEDQEGIAFAQGCMQAVKARQQKVQPAAVAIADQPRSGPARKAEALAVSGPSKQQIDARVQEIVARVVGIDEELVAIDRPLMEAGITSQAAILLRNEMQKSLEGIQFPATLLFDFPTVGAITRMVLDVAHDIPGGLKL